MTSAATHFGTVFLAFFAIMNPVANATIFLGLTEGFDSATRRSIALRAVLLAFAIVALFALFGRGIFSVFGISLPAFRIAGGALVGLVGYHLLQGQDSPIHTPSDEDNAQSRDAAVGLAVTPLAMPILAGPGTITTAMNYAADSTLPELFRVLAAMALVCAMTWVAFVGSNVLVRFVGRNAIKVISRLLGLILAVIGVQMVIMGVRGAMAIASAP